MSAELHIPDEAIEAVLRALDGDYAKPLSEQTADDVAECRTVLAAAAPAIVAANEQSTRGLLRGMARRASAFRRNYVQAAQIADDLLRERYTAAPEGGQ
jgi:hypothetical protein